MPQHASAPTVAEVVPIAPNGRLDEALTRALGPKRLLAIVAAHAGARQPTSWRAAMERRPEEAQLDGRPYTHVLVDGREADYEALLAG